mmetsp:Transcript_98833/g.279311  ORF Transcript_98833/g.279311 Transcript_98833/m.279311 type:complete len:193 (+) Transcript_98833:145-723(+)
MQNAVSALSMAIEGWRGRGSEVSKERDLELGRCLDSDSENEDEVRVYQARSARPLTLEFTVPEAHPEGQRLWVSGPFGPLAVGIPVGVAPGHRCTMMLGPPGVQRVTVPDGLRPGDLVGFTTPSGSLQQVPLPEGVGPGDSFEVVPPALLVEVPRGARAGDHVEFATPRGKSVRRALVPAGVGRGEIIAVSL